MSIPKTHLPGLDAEPTAEVMEELALSGLLRLHGFVTGIAVTPKRLAQDVWVNHVLESDDTPRSADDEEMVKVLLQQMFAQILEGLNGRNPTFSPPAQPGNVADAQVWADGFFDAMTLCMDDWQRLQATPDINLSIVPILLLTTEDEEQKQLYSEAADKSFEDLEFAASVSLRDSVLALNQHAKKLRGPLQAHDAAPGRNDPCICGSGKKYKKCCGR